jgi:proteic killer suppression protein
VEIRNCVHKGLKKLYMEDSVKGLPPDAVDKLRAMPTYLQDMEDPEELRAFPPVESPPTHGGAQRSLEPARYAQHTRNWRLTFRIEDGEILDVDYEDYH